MIYANYRAALFVLVLFLGGKAALAQSTNPTYISQFPTLERVKSVITGKDAMDTAAKQVGAFWQLRKIVEQMAAFRGYRNQFTPDEGRLIGIYNLGYQTAGEAYAKYPDRAAWYNAHTNYEQSDDLREEIFAKLLSPQIRAQWAQTETNTKNTTAAGRAARDKAANDEGVVKIDRGRPSQPTARGAGPGSAGSSSVPPHVDVADADLIKAKGARVDTLVAGIQLGAPFRYSDCNLLEVRPKSVCIPIDAGGFFGDLIQDLVPDVDPNIKTVMLPNDSCPTWTPTNCRAYITLYQGRIVGVALLTKGRGVVTAAKAELQEKYGRPTGFKNATVTPDEGNPFKVSDPEWVLPGLHVEFETVLKEGDRVNLSNGVVRIETASAYARRLEKGRKVKRKL